MIYITGDTHGNIDIHKLTSEEFPEGNDLTRRDYVIICGDFGLIWDNSSEERYWLRWLDKKPWTTLWIDGNHENFDLLDEYDIVDWHGAKVQFITGNIIHIMRGSVFSLDGYVFFAFGGAESHDKDRRVPGRSWWEAELPSDNDKEAGLRTLDAAGWSVDVVITHTLPGKIQQTVFREEYPANSLNDYFDMIEEKLDYSFWFSGHYHRSGMIDDDHILIYNAIVKLNDEGFEVVRDDEENRLYIDDDLSDDDFDYLMSLEDDEY